MEERVLGKTGRAVSVVGLGTWQLGADWGEVADADALAALEAAAQAGVTFFDTADVYGDGRSERLIGRFLAAESGPGGHGGDQDGPPRRPGSRASTRWPTSAHGPTGPGANLGIGMLDLVQLHCPPTPVYSRDAVLTPWISSWPSSA